MKDYIKKTIETYNKIAKIYADYTFNLLLQFHLNEFIKLLPKKAKILDAGCGPGRDVQYFLDYNLEPIGIDISDGILKEARKRVKATFKKMDILDLKFKENNFDGIWCSNTLPHIDKKDSLKALKNFNKVLKKEGILFLTVKEGKGSEIVKKEKYNNLPRYFIYYEQIEIKDLLKKTGFEIIKTETESGPKGVNWINIFCKKV